MKKLSDIAEIFSGFPFRRAIEHDAQGDVAVIQMRDIENYKIVNYQELSRVNNIHPKPHHFIQQGDILFVAKGAHNFAVNIDNPMQQTLASANFLVIRLTESNLISEYLAWFINHSPAQTYLNGQAKGSYIPSISKTALGELTIPIPSLETQNKIVYTQQLLELENQLVEKIQIKRRKMIETLLLKKANTGEVNGND